MVLVRISYVLAIFVRFNGFVKILGGCYSDAILTLFRCYSDVIPTLFRRATLKTCLPPGPNARRDEICRSGETLTPTETAAFLGCTEALARDEHT